MFTQTRTAQGAVPSIQVDNNGDMIINSDGGKIQLTQNGQQFRDVLNAPRHFGARIALRKDNTPPSIVSTFSDGGVRILSVSRDDTAGPPQTTPPYYSCGLSVAFSDNGAALAKEPICTVQAVVGGSVGTLTYRLYIAVVRVITTTGMRFWVTNTGFECETGDGVIVTCFTVD